MTAYASACNGELIQAEKVTTLFPQANPIDRLAARDAFVASATAANSAAINRSELSGDARSIGYYRPESSAAGGEGQAALQGGGLTLAARRTARRRRCEPSRADPISR